MTNAELQLVLSTRFPNITVEDAKQFLSVTTDAVDLLEVATFLRNDVQMQFDYLFCCSGVDWPTHLSVVYHLASTLLGHELVLKTKTSNRESPKLESVCHLWRTAEFHEREIFDLYGIVFENHPDLRRILLEDDWIGFPMRKDYKDDNNIVQLG